MSFSRKLFPGAGKRKVQQSKTGVFKVTDVCREGLIAKVFPHLNHLKCSEK